MPASIDVLTRSSAPVWPTVLMALKSPLPSPNVMVPKQSLETNRPVLPRVVYCISFSCLASSDVSLQEGAGRWHGQLPSLKPLHTLTRSSEKELERRRVF